MWMPVKVKHGGHFSRLLSSSEWKAHVANIDERSASDMATSVDLCSPELHSASDEDSMSSDAEHVSSGENNLQHWRTITGQQVVHKSCRRGHSFVFRPGSL